MEARRHAVIELYRCGKRPCEIVKLLQIPQPTVSKAIKRYKEQGHNIDRPRSGRPRTARTSKNIKKIRERIRRNSRVSMRKIARETGIDRESVRRIAKCDLRLRPYKLQTAQHLTESNMDVRMQRSRDLLETRGKGSYSRMRRCLRLKATTTTRMTETGVKNTRVTLTPSPTHSTQPLLWHGVEFVLRAKPP